MNEEELKQYLLYCGGGAILLECLPVMLRVPLTTWLLFELTSGKRLIGYVLKRIKVSEVVHLLSHLPEDK